MFVTKDRKL